MVDFAALTKKNLRKRQFMGVDFEGQSLLDITEVGGTQYAAHESTDILCLGYQPWLTTYTDAPTEPAPIWEPEQPFSAELVDAVRSEEWTFVAHNAQFDRTFWRHMHQRGKLPVEAPKHWICTAQRASINGLPRGLDEACKAMGLPGKDKEGAAVLMRWCKPFKRGKTTTFTKRADIPRADRDIIARYCGIDIARMWQIMAGTLGASEEQLAYFELDYRINCRGFGVDMAGVDQAIQRLNEAQMELRERSLAVTGGDIINLNSPDQLRKFCADLRYPMAAMDAHHIRMALADPHCPPLVKSMLELRQLAALKASSKFAAFRQRGMVEGEHLVIRDWGVVDGASTGRHTAKGYQAHNMKREIASEAAVDSLLNEPLEVTRLLFDEPLRLAGMAVRPMVIARKPKHVLLIGDFAKIELCTLFWFAGELKALAELAAGVDLYKRLAAVIYREIEARITKEQRQLGKTGVLGNGYGLGAAGFQKQLTEKYGIFIDEETSERAVYGYRNMFPGVPKFWHKLGDAMVLAVTNKGIPYQLGPLKVVASDAHMVIVLPDGSKIRYQKPFIRGNDVWYYGEDDKTKQFTPQKLWGGAATGHVVQATANRLQRCAAFDLEAANFDIVLHAHDELVAEDVPTRLDEFRDIMSMKDARRPWMKGMLIEVDAVATRRYRKG